MGSDVSPSLFLSHKCFCVSELDIYRRIYLYFTNISNIIRGRTPGRRPPYHQLEEKPVTRPCGDPWVSLEPLLLSAFGAATTSNSAFSSPCFSLRFSPDVSLINHSVVCSFGSFYTRSHVVSICLQRLFQISVLSPKDSATLMILAEFLLSEPLPWDDPLDK